MRAGFQKEVLAHAPPHTTPPTFDTPSSGLSAELSVVHEIIEVASKDGLQQNHSFVGLLFVRHSILPVRLAWCNIVDVHLLPTGGSAAKKIDVVFGTARR